MAKYELVVTSDNVLSSPLTLTVLDIVGPRGEAGPQGPSGPAGATTLSGLTDVDTDSATIGQLLQADGDDTYSFVTVAGATNTLDDVTSNNNTTTNDISVGGVTATSLNTHTIPGGTGTLALSSDIPTVPINNNQLTNGAGYITDYTVTQGDVTSHQAALSITESQINDHGTYATLVGGTVPASQLPSYVDDVEEYATYAGFPGTGEAGKIYVDIATGDIYRWSGSGYVQINDAVSSADQATRLATARTISLGGDVTGSASFDGTADITITAAVADDSHDHTIANVDGLQTALDGKLASTSTTDNITEGSSNLYYTDARANSAFDIRIATKDTDDLSEGSTNLYYTNARFDTQLATKDTGDLTEGSNLYYTNARFDTQLATKDTGDLGEGSNLYYTDARVLTKINATSIDDLNDVDTTTDTPSDGQVLTWDDTAGYWKPSPVSGGGGGGSGDITSVVAGSGLTGGASTGDATLNVGAGSFITVAADTVAVDATDANTASKVVARDASGNFSASTITASLTGNVTGTVSDVSNHDTDDITEGSTNLYYTDARDTANFNTNLADSDTGDLSEGSNLYYTDARSRVAISVTGAGGDGSLAYNNTTGVITFTGPSASEVRAHLSAGGDLSYDSNTGIISFTERTDAEVRQLLSVSGDLSYNNTTGVFSFTERTDAEVRGLVSATGDLSYNSTTGVFSFTERTDAEVRELVSASFSGGDGAFSYDNSTGVFTHTGPSAAETRAHFTGGTGVTITNGEVAIGQAVGTGSDVTFNDVTVSNNLTVNGSTTTIDSTTVAVTDSLFKLAKDNTADSLDAGWYGVYNDGTEKYAGIARDASDSGKFILYDGLQVEPTTTVNTAGTGFNKATLKADIEGDVTGNVTGTVSSLSNHDTGDLAEGTNLYYTDARADARVNLQTGANLDLSSKSTTNLSEGTNLYYTQARFDTAFGNKNTSDLSEGTNLYYTDARADARVNLQTGTNLDLSSKSTTDLSEGTNLYYTDARVDGHLNQSNPTDGYVLSWTNNDYAWVAQSGGSGSIQSEEFPTVTNGSANVTMSQSYALTHIEVYLNGVKLRGGASNDYDVSGTTLTFSENLQSGDVVCVVSLESASTFTISGTFANLTDTSVGSQASNTLIKYNGSAYVPTSLSEDSSGNVTSLVAGDSGNVSVDIRKANVRTTTGTVDLVGGASLYNAGAAATYSCANLNKGDIVTVYAAAASVAVVPGASTSLFKDGDDITGTSETSVAIGQHTIATITMISDTVAIITGSAI